MLIDNEIGEIKNCDTVMDGTLTEFKKITGGEKAISKRFKEALKQGENVFFAS